VEGKSSLNLGVEGEKERLETTTRKRHPKEIQNSLKNKKRNHGQGETGETKTHARARNVKKKMVGTGRWALGKKHS